jgi:hypothetical protein
MDKMQGILVWFVISLNVIYKPTVIRLNVIYKPTVISLNAIYKPTVISPGLTLEGDSGEEVALWLLTSLFLVPKENWKSPLLLRSRFANFNCFDSKTSVYFYYKISVFSFFNVSSRHCKGA